MRSSYGKFVSEITTFFYETINTKLNLQFFFSLILTELDNNGHNMCIYIYIPNNIHHISKGRLGVFIKTTHSTFFYINSMHFKNHFQKHFFKPCMLHTLSVPLTLYLHSVKPIFLNR